MCIIIFSLLINAVVLLLNCLVLILYLYIPFLSLKMLFCLCKHHLGLFVADTALKVSRSLYCFTTTISHGVENNFPSCGVQPSLMLVLFTAHFRSL